MSASVEGKMALIHVCDTGIGIPKAEVKSIFKSFFRASNAVNSQEMGSGLGLMLTQKLVEKLGGKLSFVSEEGKGTTFSVVLPLGHVTDPSVRLVEEKQKVATETPSAEDKHPETCQTVSSALLQDADLCKYIRMTFGDSYQVVDVESAEAALKYLQEGGECDIVVSDVMMPGMHGDELCRLIKENNETSWLPVILLTAKTGRDFMIEGLALGADDYIAKPFDTAILASKVASILTNRRRLSQYYMDRTLALVRGGEMAPESAPPQQTICPDSCENAEEAVLNPHDQAFVDKATSFVLAHLSDTDFNIDRLCREMAMSRTLFYGRLKTLTGQNPQDFMRLIRLEQAAIFLKHGDSVMDVSVKAGFVNVKYFSTVFKKHFGVSPSKYL